MGLGFTEISTSRFPAAAARRIPVGAPLVRALFGPNHAEGRHPCRPLGGVWRGDFPVAHGRGVLPGAPYSFAVLSLWRPGAWKDAGPRSAPRTTTPLVWRVILGALFRALGEIEARRLDVLVLFFEGRSVLSLVFALGGEDEYRRIETLRPLGFSRMRGRKTAARTPPLPTPPHLRHETGGLRHQDQAVPPERSRPPVPGGRPQGLPRRRLEGQHIRKCRGSPSEYGDSGRGPVISGIHSARPR